jgi:hypothetical protein
MMNVGLIQSHKGFAILIPTKRRIKTFKGIFRWCFRRPKTSLWWYADVQRKVSNFKTGGSQLFLFHGFQSLKF